MQIDDMSRIAVALERIANHLDFFAEFVKKEMDEEDAEETRPLTERQTVTLYFTSSEFLKLYLFVKDRCDNYGFCRLGDVKEKFKRGVVDFTDWKYGWKDPGNMVINELDDDRIELICTNLVLFKI